VKGGGLYVKKGNSGNDISWRKGHKARFFNKETCKTGGFFWRKI